jgi:hypothetical protein
MAVAALTSAASMGKAVRALGRAGAIVRRAGLAARVASDVQKVGAARFVAIGLVGVVILVELMVAAPVAIVTRALDQLTVRPSINVAMDAYQASRSCNFAGGDGLAGTSLLLAQAFLATGAGDPVLARGASPFGVYRNPLAGLPGYDPLGGTQGMHIEPRLLAGDGAVVQELGLTGAIAPADWTTIGSVRGEHGIGFLLIRPTDWKQWEGGSSLAAHLSLRERADLDPYRPGDAFLVTACHLLDLVTTAGMTLEQALAALAASVQQLWSDIEAGLSDLRDLVLAGRLAEASAAGAALAAHELEQVTGRYYLELEAFVSPPPGSGAADWPADPPPIPLGTKGLVPLPPGLWYPAVSQPGFSNPFPDRSQCTWFAYQAYAAFDHDAPAGVNGDAGDWIGEAEQVARLRPRLLTPGMAAFAPVEGAVISFARSSGQTGSMPFGHVGIVRKVQKDSQGRLWMLIWDANWDLAGGRYQHWESWNVWQGRVAGFIRPPTAPTGPADIKKVIADAFAPLGPAAQQWGLKIAWCESRDDPRAINSTPVGSEHAEGLFQFLPSTFAGTPPGQAGSDIFDPIASARAAAWMYGQGRQGEWQCNQIG